MALDLGLRPLEWERYQPCEILAMRDARDHRRRRDLAALAVAVATIANRIPFAETPADPRQLLDFMDLYDPPPAELELPPADPEDV